MSLSIEKTVTKMKYIIGCSGFHYKHWKGDFYPEDLPVRKWFEFYCEHFNTLELNVSFYRFPTPSMLQGWYQKSPENFIFAVKVPRSITHFKKLLNTENMLRDFYRTVKLGLKEKLGCILFQFPPNFAYSAEHLQRIINSLDNDFKNIVEFRHSSWWTAEIYAQLGERKIGFCGMSHPEFPDELVYNAEFLYYRLHGQPDLYRSNYTETDLARLYEKLASLRTVKEAFVYFNNDVKGYATKNAASLQQKALGG